MDKFVSSLLYSHLAVALTGGETLVFYYTRLFHIGSSSKYKMKYTYNGRVNEMYYLKVL